MSNISQFMGGRGFVLQELIQWTSGTFVTPLSTKYILTAIGGGAGANGASYSNRGSGAGGFSQKIINLPAGFTLTYNIGAGGLAGNAGTATNGGTTTITGTGISMTANGGTVGGMSNGGNGGTASGGDINFTGGSTIGRGGAATSIYGIISTNNSDQGAGVGGGAATSYPGSCLMDGSIVQANQSNMFHGFWASGTQYPVVGGFGPQHTPTRFLTPKYGFSTSQHMTGLNGVGGSTSVGVGPGCFAGGAAFANNQGPSRGGLGGGGAGVNTGTGLVTGNPGGQGLVIIEYFI